MCVDRNNMANQKQKERKKKQRERRAKERVQARRNAVLARRKREKELSKLDEKTSLNKWKPTPIRNDDKANEVQRRLEHNARILKALEEELIKELESKENLNEELEKEGYKTLEEKVKALTKQARQEAGLPADMAEILGDEKSL